MDQNQIAEQTTEFVDLMQRAQGLASRASANAAALRASLDQVAVLSPGERHLMAELLDRIARGG